MQLETALRLFGLSPGPSREQLNKAFRKLAKRYHPDSNGERVEWATTHMSSINVAYETIRQSIENRPPGGESAGASSNGRTRANQSRSGGSGSRGRSAGGSTHSTRFGGDSGSRYRRGGASPRQEGRAAFSSEHLAELSASHRMILDGMLLYYQFGLENVHARQQGSLRLKYRRATRLVHHGLEKAQSVKAIAGRFPDEWWFSAFVSFAELFHEVMLQDRYHNPYDVKAERLAYRHYHHGSDLLDEAVRESFFFGYFTNSGQDIVTTLGIAAKSFANVLQHFPETSWSEESVLKAHVIDALERYLITTKKR